MKDEATIENQDRPQADTGTQAVGGDDDDDDRGSMTLCDRATDRLVLIPILMLQRVGGMRTMGDADTLSTLSKHSMMDLMRQTTVKMRDEIG